MSVKVTDVSTGKGIPSVNISEKSRTLSMTDSAGNAQIKIETGLHELVFTSVGYKPFQRIVNIPPDHTIEVKLTPEEKELGEVTIIASSRNNQRIENSPMKVEVLGREEMDEENMIKPGNIASILGDVSGIQIQQTSAASGNSNVRIQGLEGRYTQILQDGIPLFDGFSGSFGILSIPPLDLKQIELIKGSASTLYGGGAIGGLINIISRKPSGKKESTFTLNQSTLKESNINSFISGRNRKTGYTLYTGLTRQKEVDVNKDGLSDVPEIHSMVVHPKFFWYPSASTTVTVGYTATIEKRKGGDMLVLSDKADNIHRFFETNELTRHTITSVLEQKLSKQTKLEFKNSFSSFNRTISTADHTVKANQQNVFSELSLLVPGKKYTWVSGLNFYSNRFRKLSSDPVAIDHFANNTIGAFTQLTVTIHPKTTFEAGIRNDYIKSYGNFLLPRVSLFHRFNEHWGTRVGAGSGYKIPNPLASQITDYYIWQLAALPQGIKAEKSMGYNAEINYKKRWKESNEVFINHAFFLTSIYHPVVGTEEQDGLIHFSNASKAVVTKGIDTYIQIKLAEWEIYTGYTYTVAERKYLQQNQYIPYTPKTRMAFTLVREWEEKWRVGIEGSYNGYQRRDDYSKTPGYFFMAGMIQYNINNYVSVVLNGENLLDYRQSKTEDLFSGSITNPAFHPLWAPIDGRIINLSLKVSLK